MQHEKKIITSEGAYIMFRDEVPFITRSETLQTTKNFIGLEQFEPKHNFFYQIDTETKKNVIKLIFT